MKTELTSKTSKNVIVKDINDIYVCVPNEHLPIVIPYGPMSCGKTMVVIRLCKYLLNRGYRVKPVRDFRPDIDYQGCCERFEQLLYLDDTAPATNPLGFILIEISDKNGCPICYLFDAEGNCYFDPLYPQAYYPSFFSSIICSPNPKQYIFFAEHDWGDCQMRQNYVQRIAAFRAQCSYKDSAIILYNKVDNSNFIAARGLVIKTKDIAQHCRMLYNGLFDLFRMQTPILRWFQPYKFSFVPFSSGIFFQYLSRMYKYSESIDVYPQKLWKAILKNIS